MGSTIPVILTSTDVAELYAPTTDAYINAADFASPDELALYMTTVLQNDTLRASFSAWKKNATLVRTWTRQQMGSTISGGPGLALCKLCEAYVKKWGCNLLDPAPQGCPKPNPHGGHPEGI